MRIALISDIHGNELALEKVLDDIHRTGVDRIVCLGDVATLGPRPVAVIARLRDLGCACIMGNHDEFMLDFELVRTYTKIPVLADAIAWCREELSQEDVDFIRTFRSSIEVPLDGGVSLRLFHGTPESNTVDLLATTPADVLDEMLGQDRAPIMAGGHTHLQMLRQHRGILVVNPGSVGMPFKEYVARTEPVILPHAEYAIVETLGGSVSVHLRRVPLDKAMLRQAASSVHNPLCASLIRMYS